MMSKRKKLLKVDPSITHDKQRQVLDLMIELYGDDADLIVNALHEMAARVGIACGIEPEIFAAGMKHHWDGIANAISEFAERGRH